MPSKYLHTYEYVHVRSSPSHYGGNLLSPKIYNDSVRSIYIATYRSRVSDSIPLGRPESELASVHVLIHKTAFGQISLIYNKRSIERKCVLDINQTKNKAREQRIYKAAKVVMIASVLSHHLGSLVQNQET